MSQYTASIPSSDSNLSSIQKFFESFYAISDDPTAHEKYADCFTKDATLVMASKTVRGREDIIGMRHSMWEKVAKRSHVPEKLYAFEAGDVMLYGTVDYTLKDGRGTKVEWSARAHFTEGSDGLKMDFYQVYLDTAAMANAK